MVQIESSIMIRTLSLLVVLLLALVLNQGLTGSPANAQDLDQGVESSGTQWRGVPADRIVNVNGTKTWKRYKDSLEIYEVPEGQWLVITDFRRMHLEALNPQLDMEMRLKGSKKNNMVMPWRFSEAGFSSHFGGNVGLKFPPESKIMLSRTWKASQAIDSDFMMTGYLIPDRVENDGK